MFKVTEVKQYDRHNYYGTDWHTDYVFETDEPITDLYEAIRKVKDCGYIPDGVITLKGNVLETYMF